ncbi:uncharacterized protein BO66DRAFT_164210 [Aspergillus aculeatinus CBS 121060]|uniref:Uncharacterized protein n=1 Tax=Aspergillus aculeatinus CBS 121060 TaxID=1448322 RepID=A0ACD1GZL8_9EURO|nr:hypothetical protein BO66DRAFT_164210 [Aspergillus aculeatinus CBS 121060]RAH66931.1 hypothetical protein BO66DRAFT_164210 [Aspergillus aculeatinus CBS 121060]
MTYAYVFPFASIHTLFCLLFCRFPASCAVVSLQTLLTMISVLGAFFFSVDFLLIRVCGKARRYLMLLLRVKTLLLFTTHLGCPRSIPHRCHLCYWYNLKKALLLTFCVDESGF